MSEQPADTESVIHRKAKVARDEFDAREMSPSKALRLALAKAASTQFELPLVVRMVEHECVALTGIEERVGEDGLLILLDGVDGPPGAIRLDLQFVMAMIEVQLMGDVRKGEARPRPFTPTDAAIIQPLMNAVLEGYAEQMNACDSVPDAAFFRFGDRVEDGRALVLSLWAPDYDLYRLKVDFGPGAKTGVMELILPERPPEPDVEEAGGSALARKLEENAMNAPVMLDAVLAPLRLPLQDICRWKPGTLLHLSPEVVSGARIIGAKGHKVALAKMGQLNGFRAVRMVLKTGGDEEASDRTDATGAARGRASIGSMDAGPVAGPTDLPDMPDMLDMPDLSIATEPSADGPDIDLSASNGEAQDDSALDTLVEEELARAAERFERDEQDDDMPMTGGPSLSASKVE